jgi:hypothetical protein
MEACQERIIEMHIPPNIIVIKMPILDSYLDSRELFVNWPEITQRTKSILESDHRNAVDKIQPLFTREAVLHEDISLLDAINRIILDVLDEILLDYPGQQTYASMTVETDGAIPKIVITVYPNSLGKDFETWPLS